MRWSSATSGPANSGSVVCDAPGVLAGDLINLPGQTADSALRLIHQSAQHS